MFMFTNRHACPFFFLLGCAGFLLHIIPVQVLNLSPVLFDCPHFSQSILTVNVIGT